MDRCCFPAAFLDVLAARLGEFVRLMLVDPVGTDAARTLFPTGRLVAVRSNYVALADVHIDGVAHPELGVVEIVLGFILGVSRAKRPS